MANEMLRIPNEIKKNSYVTVACMTTSKIANEIWRMLDEIMKNIDKIWKWLSHLSKMIESL
jgi:hypothetical protein